MQSWPAAAVAGTARPKVNGRRIAAAISIGAKLVVNAISHRAPFGARIGVIVAANAVAIAITFPRAQSAFVGARRNFAAKVVVIRFGRGQNPRITGRIIVMETDHFAATGKKIGLSQATRGINGNIFCFIVP